MNRYFFSSLLCAAFLISSAALAAPSAESKRKFWVWDFSANPAVMRQITANLRSIGTRTLIYSEDGLEEASNAMVGRLYNRLEMRTPARSIYPELGIVPLEEKLFGRLPPAPSGDSRLVALLVKHGEPDHPVLFNPIDQQPESLALGHGIHSNEANILYVDPRNTGEMKIARLIAHELQHLLTYQSGSGAGRDSWLAETLSEAAVLLSGYLSDSTPLEVYTGTPQDYSVVSHSDLQLGAHQLFAVYLLDSMPDKVSGIAQLLHGPPNGREAVELFFQSGSSRPISFDLIFSNFVGYVFGHESKMLPASLRKRSLRLPVIQPYVISGSFPFVVEGSLMPYTFLSIELPAALPPTAIVEVEKIMNNPAIGSCAERGTVLWKPVSPTRIAIYSVGCEQRRKLDELQFRLKVLDKPLQAPRTARKILL
jgi:hypothetical protein